MAAFSRRDFVTTSAGAGAALLAGCGPKPVPANCAPPAAGASWAWRPDEEQRLSGQGSLAIVERGGEDSRVLRTRARDVPADLDLTEVARRMASAMESAGGVGIAGPQVGLYLRVATLMLDYKTDHPFTVFTCNPVIVERSDETIEGYEGCLSVPGVGGLVRRSRWIAVEYADLSGQPQRVEAEDHNAVLWQHELDHLDGVLYVDRLLGELLPMDEVRRLRKEAEEQAAGGQPSARGYGDCLEGSSLLVTRVG